MRGGGSRVGAEAEPQDASQGEGEGSPPVSRPPEGVSQATPPGSGVLPGHALGRPHAHTRHTDARTLRPPVGGL